MGNNILVVESKNDKFFLNAIIDYLNFDIDITEPILIEESDYLSMDGLDPTKLEKTLKDLKADIQKGAFHRKRKNLTVKCGAKRRTLPP